MGRSSSRKGAAWLSRNRPSINGSRKRSRIRTPRSGIVRITPKKQVREGVEGLGEVAQVEFSYDAAGVEAAVQEALTWPGVYYVRTWLNEGVLNVGDSIMYVLIGADIRPNCIDALQKLVGKIKNDLVEEKEIYA